MEAAAVIIVTGCWTYFPCCYDGKGHLKSHRENIAMGLREFLSIDLRQDNAAIRCQAGMSGRIAVNEESRAPESQRTFRWRKRNCQRPKLGMGDCLADDPVSARDRANVGNVLHSRVH